jgi:hypothetical protein
MSDVEPGVENVAEAPEVQEPAMAEPEAAPAESKRGRGRPAGSKDVKPRKRKVTIVEEPLAKAPAKEPEAPEAPEVQGRGHPVSQSPRAPRGSGAPNGRLAEDIAAQSR